MEIFLEEDRFHDMRNGVRIYLSDFIKELLEFYDSGFYAGLTKITDFNPGSEAYHELIRNANMLMDKVILQDNECSQHTFKTANFSYLDDFGHQKCVYREEATFATGPVKFTIPNSIIGTRIFPDGMEISTPDGVIFTLNEEVRISAGELSEVGNVTCIEEGTIGNVNTGEINIIIDDPGFPCSVVNENDFTNGVNEEEDEDYRERIRFESENYPPFGYAWMEYKAKKIVPDARYSLNELGNIGTIHFKPGVNDNDVILLTNFFNDKKYKPALVNLQFVEADSVTVIDGNMRIIIFNDPAYSFNIIKEQAINIVNDYIDTISMGGLYEINMLRFNLMTIEGVVGVDTSNMVDVNLAINEYPIIDNLNNVIVQGG